MTSSIEYQNDFYSTHLEYFLDFYNEIKEKFKLLGFISNSKAEEFIKIIIDNLNFKDSLEDDEEEYDTDFSEEEYID
tara:strand:- start:544 stop:774 length:231 start_codon:yes stop_codon:yes gene_type:complete